MSNVTKLFSGANDNQVIPAYLNRLHAELVTRIEKKMSEYGGLQYQNNTANDKAMARIFAETMLYAECFIGLYPALKEKPVIDGLLYEALAQSNLLDCLYDDESPENHICHFIRHGGWDHTQFWLGYIPERAAQLCEEAIEKKHYLHGEYMSHTQAVMEGLYEGEKNLILLIRRYFGIPDPQTMNLGPVHA